MVRYLETHVLIVGFSRAIAGSEVVHGDNASSVHCTDDARGVAKTRYPRPGEEYLILGDDSRMKVASFRRLGMCPIV